MQARCLRYDSNTTLRCTVSRPFGNAFLDGGDQFIVEPRALAQHDEQANLNVRVRRFLSHDDAVDDLFHRLDLPIDFRGADTHAAGVERGIGSARRFG